MLRFVNISPPLAAAGILRPWNQELGWRAPGPLYSMTDPFYMLMLIGNLGDNYIVWDKAAHIRFRKPGKGKVRAEFGLTEAYLGTVLRCRRMSFSCRGVQPSLHGEGRVSALH